MLDSYRLGDWLVEPMLLRVSKNGEIKKLEPQLMAVLQELVSKSGLVVSKESLLEAVWRDVIVTENVLTRAISSLRKTLEDDRFDPNYIETISKTGYRLVASVKRGEVSTKQKTSSVRFMKRPIAIAAGFVVLLALVAFSVRRILPVLPTKVYLPFALANYSNAEYWPAISPDGKFVAYGWKGKNNDNWDIYAKLIGTETTLRITESPATELRAEWSADGNYIYYLRYEDGGSTIYKKSVIGDKEIRILRTPAYSFGDFDVSPDEKWVSFNDRQDQMSPLRLKLISLETGEEKWLTAPEDGYNGDIHSTFSPDGTQLAFIREKNSASMQLWLFDLNTEELEQLTSEHISINGFDWSPDASSLIYGSDKSGLYKLWEVNLATKESNIMQVGDYQMVMPRVAETGKTVYAKMKDNVNIWTYNLKNKTAKAWRATNDLNLNPVVSPNGKKVAFTMNKDRKFEIWVSNLDGSQAVPITNFMGQHINAPRWSPDSESIVFQGFLDGQADIYQVNALGGVPVNLTKSGADDHTPFFAKNNIIYFSSNRGGEWGIWKMNVNGTSVIQVVGKNAYAPQVSRDESTIFYCKKDNFGLWAYDLEKEEERLVIEPFHPMHWGSFTVVEKGIYYLNAQDKRFEYFDFDSSQSSFVYQPQARIPRLGITLHLSPDSQRLMFSQIDNHDSDIMLLEEQL